MTVSALTPFISRTRPAAAEPLYVNDTLSEIGQLLTQMEQAVVPQSMERTAALHEKLQSFRVNASLIGQVKAGKTALANGMIGRVGMLPSDVNPWTSVVTSIHMNTPRVQNKQAIFKFFNKEEWDGMLDAGSRVAKMAKNASFEDEFNAIRDQIEDMQSRTVARLGKNFKMLLGNQHAFSEFNAELIKRYVCLGEEDETAEREGRFADLTKSADLYIDNDLFDYPIMLADTPGVNDPFLVREAATLQNLGRSDVCVVVLSAHQALSTVDIALMRILLSLKQEQIVLFINRIDELENPDAQIQEINSYIRTTLHEQGLSDDIPLIFGSAAWAEAQVLESFATLPEDSIAALDKLVADRMKRLPQGAKDDANIDNLEDVTGMTALQRVMDAKSQDDVSIPFAQEVASNAIDLAEQSRVFLQQTVKAAPSAMSSVDLQAVVDELDTLIEGLHETFSVIHVEESENIIYNMSGQYQEFISTESKSLFAFLEGKGKLADWSPDTEHLRKGLNDVYDGFADHAVARIDELHDNTAETIQRLYIALLGHDADNLDILTPAVKDPGVPTALMRTVNVDLSTTWVTGWLTRKLKKDAYVEKFKKIAMDDMHTTMEEVRHVHVDQYFEAVRADLVTFVEKHTETLKGLMSLDSTTQRHEILKGFGLEDEVRQRIYDLEEITAKLHVIANNKDAEPAPLKKVG